MCQHTPKINMPARRNAPNSMHELNLSIGGGIWTALQQQSQRTGESLDHIIRHAISESLDLDHHTIHQVSTSGALVKGVYQGCVNISEVKRYGDFGLGTFDALDGEGIMLDGICWQACGDGRVLVAPDDALAPFWTTTFFKADRSITLNQVNSWDDLIQILDQERISENIFYAIRVRGIFKSIQYRVACKAEAGADLVEATNHQAEFHAQSIAGTLVGFWTPAYARTINVPGYHLHLLSDDRQHAGHVLDVAAEELTVEIHQETELQVVLPETSDFLQADLNGDPAEALAKAEGKHS